MLYFIYKPKWANQSWFCVMYTKGNCSSFHFLFGADLHVQTEIHLCFLCGWDYKKYVMDKWNAPVNNPIFTWVVVSIKMSLPLFIFSDVSLELYTLDLICPWNMNYLHWLHKNLSSYMFMWLLTQICLAEHQKCFFFFSSYEKYVPQSFENN